MISVVQERDQSAHRNLLDGMFRLRARVFADRLRWDVRVCDGMERDAFDDQGPVYLIHTNRDGAVDGSCRLLPTTGPTLLAETFYDTLPDAVHLSSPGIWECSRFCVEPGTGSDKSLAEVTETSRSLVAAIGEVALKARADTILGNFDRMMLRIYRRIGCPVEILGCTYRFGAPVYLGAFPVSQDILDGVKRRSRTSAERLPTPLAA